MSHSDGPARLVVPVEPDQSGDRGPAGEGAPASESVAPVAPRPVQRTGRWRAFLARTSLGVWIGLFITVAGFGLIALTWGKTASLIDVAAQVPYLVSGGLTGLGLILVGLLVVNLAVKRREAQQRERQLEELREALVRLRASIEGQPDEEP